MVIQKIPADIVRTGRIDAGAFSDYITQHIAARFKWGEHDCITFSIGWVSIATGVDVLSQYNRWGTKAEARAEMARVGGIEAEFNRRLRKIHQNFAVDGDVCIVDGIAHLFSGSNIVAPSHDGLVFRNRLEAKCAWSY